MSRIANLKGPMGLRDLDATPEPKPRKPMPRKSEKRIAYEKSPEGQAILIYMGYVKQLPCCICDAFGMIPDGSSDAHHPIHGRFSSRKAPGQNVIPVCPGHHQGLWGSDKIAIHAEPSKWKRLYGPDTDYIAVTQDKVARLFGYEIDAVLTTLRPE